MILRGLLVLLLFFLQAQAVSLQWCTTYESALKEAQNSGKNVMVLVSTPQCRWCRKLLESTLQDEQVVLRLQKDYLAVHLSKKEAQSRGFKLDSVPATLFVNPQGKLIINTVIGYWSAEDYLSYLDDVDYKLGRKFY